MRRVDDEECELSVNVPADVLLGAMEDRMAAREERKNTESLIDEVTRLRAIEAARDSACNADAAVYPREKNPKIREAALVCALGDVHAAEVVEPESVAGRNSYNLAICEHRLLRWAQGVCWMVRHHRASRLVAIRDLVIPMLGDLISGRLHEDSAETDELTPSQTIIWLLPRLRGALDLILRETKPQSLIIPCSYGNHGRYTYRSRIATGADNSFETMLYQMLRDAFIHDKRVHFNITRSAHQYTMILGHKLHTHHGDSMRYWGGIGGLSVPLLKAVGVWNSWPDPASIHLVGHWHQSNVFLNGKAFVNGSLVGTNAYAQSIRAPFEEPSQISFLIDKTRGACMYSPIWVTDHDPEPAGKE
jgi:hypothetical protein